MSTDLKKLAEAAVSFTRRQLGSEQPEGKFDNAKRWYPSDYERRDCCESLRSPSRSYPFSIMTHCRTLRHVANLHGVEKKQLKKIIDTEYLDSYASIDLFLKNTNSDSAVAALGTAEVAAERKSRSL